MRCLLLALVFAFATAPVAFSQAPREKAAASPRGKTAAPAEPTLFRVRLTEDLGTLDWNYGEVNSEIQYQLMEGLFRTNAKGEAVHAAAAAHFWNKDKTEMRVQISPDRRWSDGAPICAQQFVDSWARLADKTFASPYAHYANFIKKVEAASCHELKVFFTRPSPEAPAFFSHYVFFPIRLDQLKQNPRLFREGKGLLVNGPFQVVSWDHGQKITLEPNPNYGGKKPALAKVEFYFVPDDGTAQVLFEQQKLDWVREVPPLLRTPAVEKSASFRVFPSLTAFYFGLNDSKSALLKDPVIRAGLSQALDRREFPKVMGKEYQGTRAWLLHALLPNLKTPPRTDAALEPAKKLLQAAQNVGKMDLRLEVYEGSAQRLLAEWAQSQWEKKLGIYIPIEVREGKTYWNQLGVNPPPIYLSGVTAPYAHPLAFLQEFLSTSTANWTSWRSPAYDAAVNGGHYQEAEDLLEKDGYVMPLYRRDTVALVQPGWKNFFVNPLDQVFLQDVTAEK